MTQKSAMTELFEKYGHLLPNIEDKYIELERTQIEEAYSYGYMDGYNGDAYDKSDYYTKTYKNETR